MSRASWTGGVNTEWPNMHVNKNCKKERRVKMARKVFQEVMAKCSLSRKKKKSIKLQETL